MKLAVIGTGIAGMTAAYLLSREHTVTVYEANDYVGGHTHTVEVPLNGQVYPVDTGFIVFNLKTYPNFVKLIRHLDVHWKPSRMSFSVQCARTGITFSPSSLSGLFCQRKNLLRPAFYRMLYDVLRFRKEALSLLDNGSNTITLNDYLQQHRYSKAFVERFIIPMGAAIWSADPHRFREFPARYFVEFFNNHGFLNIRDKPRWQVIRGGSRQYIAPLTRPYRNRIHLNSPVTAVRRHRDSVSVQVRGKAPKSYDKVVIATHSDQALAMLTDATEREREILTPIAYQENQTLLHTDRRVLPFSQAAWASWNYHIPTRDRGRVAVTYDMNILQGLNAPEEFCVSLNYPGEVARSRIIRELVYHHPVYSPPSLAARQRYDEINGPNNTYYCGAYWYYGFHEDGVKSALAVCRQFGLTL